MQKGPEIHRSKGLVLWKVRLHYARSLQKRELSTQEILPQRRTTGLHQEVLLWPVRGNSGAKVSEQKVSPSAMLAKPAHGVPQRLVLWKSGEHHAFTLSIQQMQKSAVQSRAVLPREERALLWKMPRTSDQQMQKQALSKDQLQKRTRLRGSSRLVLWCVCAQKKALRRRGGDGGDL